MNTTNSIIFMQTSKDFPQNSMKAIFFLLFPFLPLPPNILRTHILFLNLFVSFLRMLTSPTLLFILFLMYRLLTHLVLISFLYRNLGMAVQAQMSSPAKMSQAPPPTKIGCASFPFTVTNPRTSPFTYPKLATAGTYKYATTFSLIHPSQLWTSSQRNLHSQ